MVKRTKKPAHTNESVHNYEESEEGSESEETPSKVAKIEKVEYQPKGSKKTKDPLVVKSRIQSNIQTRVN